MGNKGVEMIYAQLEDLREAMRFNKGKFFLVLGKDGFKEYDRGVAYKMTKTAVRESKFPKVVEVMFNMCPFCAKPILKEVGLE